MNIFNQTKTFLISNSEKTAKINLIVLLIFLGLVCIYFLYCIFKSKKKNYNRI